MQLLIQIFDLFTQIGNNALKPLNFIVMFILHQSLLPCVISFHLGDSLLEARIEGLDSLVVLLIQTLDLIGMLLAEQVQGRLLVR